MEVKGLIKVKIDAITPSPSQWKGVAYVST